MKILHLSHRYWPARGGAERYMREISERLVRDGHDVTVYTTDAYDIELFWNCSAPLRRRSMWSTQPRCRTRASCGPATARLASRARA